MERITYLGAQVWPRKKNGKFKKVSTLRRWYNGMMYWLKWFAIRAGIAGAVVAFGFGMYLMGEFDQHRTIAFAANNIKVDTTPSKIETMKKEVIDDLAKLENEGGVPCYLDDNKAKTLPKKDKVSCGPMAYKVSTVQRHAKECGLGVLTDEQAVNLAIDGVKAKELAQCAIFEHGHIGEWYGATSEMVTKVKIIRELEK